MDVLEAALAAMKEGRPAALVTVVGTQGSAPREAGARMLVHGDGSIVGTVGGGAVEFEAMRQALEAIAEGAPRRYAPHLGKDLGMACGGSMDLFIEPLLRPPQLVMYGAGHVAREVAPVARQLGFQVTVVDARPEQATAERFPGCQLRVEAPREHAARLHCSPDTWVLIVTHGHAQDLEVLRALATQPLAWLGAIASRRKIATFFTTLREEGVPEDALARISSPVGLDIGAQTPAEIAISVAAEWVRLRHGVSRPSLPLSGDRAP
jgi:xanthine dehydrogenase accessory factor